MHYWQEFKKKELLLILGSIFPFLVVIATVVVWFGNSKLIEDLNTDKFVIEKLNETQPDTPRYYWKVKSYSSQFYSNGQIKNIDKVSLDSIYNTHDKFIMLIRHRRIKTIPKKFQEKMVRIDSSKRTSVFKFKK